MLLPPLVLQTRLAHARGVEHVAGRVVGDVYERAGDVGLVALGGELDDAYLDSTVLPQLQKALDDAIGEGLTRLSNSVPSDVLRDLALLAGEMAYADGYKGMPSPIAVYAGVHDAPEEIADHLAISMSTVRTHVSAVYEKLHVHSRTEAALKLMGRE